MAPGCAPYNQDRLVADPKELVKGRGGLGVPVVWWDSGRLPWVWLILTGAGASWASEPWRRPWNRYQIKGNSAQKRSHSCLLRPDAAAIAAAGGSPSAQAKAAPTRGLTDRSVEAAPITSMLCLDLENTNPCWSV